MNKKRLNDLSGTEWLTHSKSTIINADELSRYTKMETALERGALLSQAPPRNPLKKDHPATFSEKDAGRLIRFFTQQGQTVLDPFIGSGSTAIACIEEDRHCIGFELYEKWYRQATDRVQSARENPRLGTVVTEYPQIENIDAIDGIRNLSENSVDFVLTSPPYWGILEKRDHKAKNERMANGLATQYGQDERDLAAIGEYQDFLDALGQHISEYFRVLRESAYAAIIVSDFRHGRRYHLFHADVANLMEESGFVLQGLIVLIQDNKKLYPYGYPTTFVPNIANQFIVIGRKLGCREESEEGSKDST